MVGGNSGSFSMVIFQSSSSFLTSRLSMHASRRLYQRFLHVKSSSLYEHFVFLDVNILSRDSQGMHASSSYRVVYLYTVQIPGVNNSAYELVLLS